MENLDINKFLKNGDIIRTKLVGTEKWNTNIIYEIKNDILLIDMGNEENYINTVMVGDEMECKFTSGEFEYKIIGWVSKISPTIPQSITLRVEQISKYSNIREHLRYFVYLFSTIKKDEKAQDTTYSVVTDISLGGAAVFVNNGLDAYREKSAIDTMIFLEIALEDEQTVRFEGVIKREHQVKNGFEYGIQIKNIDSENKKILSEYVQELQKKDDEFQKLKQEVWDLNFIDL